MGLDAGTPPGLRETIQRIAEEAVAKFARSGFLRNASISDGGLTIKGGFLRLLTKAVGGVNLLYAGPSGAPLPDGSYQQVIVISRADGSQALNLYDAFPGVDGTLNQALTWRDRAGNAVFADDTDSGQGIARPYLPIPFYRVRDQDWPTTTSTTFEAIYRAKVSKQQPRTYLRVWAGGTAGSTGEMRVMANGTQLGATVALASGLISEFTFGPIEVPGEHMSTLTLEVQARMTGGTTGVRCCPSQVEGRQS